MFVRAHTFTGADKHDSKSKLLSMLQGDKHYGKKTTHQVRRIRSTVKGEQLYKRMIRIGLIGKVKFEQRCEGIEGISQGKI